MASAVCEPCPISQCGTRICTKLSGVTVIQVVNWLLTDASPKPRLWRPGANVTPATPRTNPPPTRLPAPMKAASRALTHGEPPRPWQPLLPQPRRSPGARRRTCRNGRCSLSSASICSSVGSGRCSGSAETAMIIPGWQLPHSGTSCSIQACCTALQLAVLRQALDRGNRHSLGCRDRQRARADGPAVEVHGAGAAGRDAAAELRARQPERLAQDPQQRRVRLDVQRAGPTIHRQRDRHARSPVLLSQTGLRPAPPASACGDPFAPRRSRRGALCAPCGVLHHTYRADACRSSSRTASTYGLACCRS